MVYCFILFIYTLSEFNLLDHICQFQFLGYSLHFWLFDELLFQDSPYLDFLKCGMF